MFYSFTNCLLLRSDMELFLGVQTMTLGFSFLFEKEGKAFDVALGAESGKCGRCVVVIIVQFKNVTFSNYSKQAEY